MKYTPYSFSKLSVHQQCNRRFKYNYLDKAPQDKSDVTALIKGGAVHSILEKYPNESTHKFAPQYQYIADRFSENLGRKYLILDSTREYNFGLTKDLKPTTYGDKTALFRGSVDFICIIDGIIYLIDWKTGKYKELKWQSFDQLMFYAIYFFQKYEKIDQIKISYVYVEHDLENDIILERKYLNNYVSQLVDLIKAAENDEEFKKNVSPLCEWCSYKTHCSKDI